MLPRCSGSVNPVIIYGNIKDLPDGLMILSGTNNKALAIPIDSTISEKGKFSFKIQPNIPMFLTLTLKGKDGIKYFFDFITNKKYKGGTWHSEFFMRDDSIFISGALKDFNPINISLNKKVKIVYPDQPIVAGRQTYVLYNVDINFNQLMTDSMVNILGDSIKKYNYSYYLLEELNTNRGNFSKEQLKHLVSIFDSSIQRSDMAIELKKSLAMRSNRQISNTTFINENNKEQKINLAQSKITMLVLWASWCGPCQMEIPILKKIYKKYANDARFRLVSISLDSKREDWLMALKQDDMPWLQLIVPQNLQPFNREVFHFNGSIPTTLFIDDSDRIFKTVEGYDYNLLDTYRKIIDAHLSSK